MSKIQKFLMPALGLVAAIASAYAAPLQALIAAHPQAAGVVAAIGAIVAAFAPQPHK